ncbi:hypothetical protein, partial [Piscinibacter sp.]|uniref:hypothetical protein n=1 Tax=Piscinibacter sp. TaxID=1903157 RepID=UPI002C5DCB33
CDQVTVPERVVVERITQLEGMPARACVVRSLGELQKVEKVDLWEFRSAPLEARQISAALDEQGAWPATLNATSTARVRPVFVDVVFHELPAGPRMTLNFNDSGQTLDQDDITTTLRLMRTLEGQVLQTCAIKAKSPTQETCNMNPALKCI